MRPQVGPASTRVRSSTRTPSSGRAPSPKGSGSLVADLDHLDDRPAGERATLRVAGPLGGVAHARSAQAALGDRVLERLRVPASDALGDLLHIVAAAEQRERAGLGVGKAAVEQEVLAVARRVDAGDGPRGIEGGDRRGIGRALEREAEQRRRGPGHIDAHALAPSAAQHPDFRRCETARGQRRGRRLSDTEPCRQHGVGACDLDLLRIGRFEPE